MVNVERQMKAYALKKTQLEKMVEDVNLNKFVIVVNHDDVFELSEEKKMELKKMILDELNADLKELRS